MVRRRLRAYDGTRLACYAAGPRDAPPIVLCGGLGGGVGVWRPLFRALASRHRILSWDYRGLYRSGPAPCEGRYELIDHAADLRTLIERAGLRRPVLIGWSMGVQVALELHRTWPDASSGLVALHGTAGRPLETAFDSALSARISPYVLAGLRRVGDRIQTLGPWLTRRPAVMSAFVGLCRRLGMMAPSLDERRFQRMAEEWMALHLGIYAEIFSQLGAHDAWDVASRLSVPALVIAGDADPFTPLAVTRELARTLPDARLEVLPGATHFGLLEYPEAIVCAVERFLEERWIPSRSPAPAPTWAEPARPSPAAG